MRLKRIKFRISLRWFLILSTGIGATIGFLGHQYLSERSAERSLVKSGFSVSFTPASRSYGRFFSQDSTEERKEAYKTFSGRVQWNLFRHVRVASGQRSAQLMHEPSAIDDASLVPLQELRHVETLFLGFQPITDEGLRYLTGLRSLKHINLCGTQITDDGLESLSELRHLEYLALEFTDITDDGLRHLVPLRRLRDIALMNTKLSGPGLEHLSQMTEMESIGISGTKIHSNDLCWLSNLPNVKSLSLSNTLIDDDASVHLSKMTSLERLWVDNTAVGDKFISGIGKLENLQNLNIEGTHVSAASAGTICGFPKLREFYAYDSSIDFQEQDRIDQFLRQRENSTDGREFSQ